MVTHPPDSTPEVDVIRQLCPHCAKLVELPPTSAGQSADCPACGKPISVPAAYAPTVSAGGGLTPPPTPEAKPMSVEPGVPPVAPPPGVHPSVFAPPSPPPPPFTPHTPQRDAVPPGYSRSISFTLSSLILDWIPIGCLLTALILSFFTWVGAYPGGYPAYTQSAWQILAADISGTAQPKGLNDLQETANWLETSPIGLRTDWFMLPYLVILIITTVLALLERAFKNPNVMSVPGPLAWLPTIWPRRFALLTLLSALLVVFLIGHFVRGKTLADAIKRSAIEHQKVEYDAAEASGASSDKLIVQVKIGQEVGKYAIQGTTFRSLVVLVQVGALLGMCGRWWLERRGNKPHPRLTLSM